MSELTPRAVRRLLEAATPLLDEETPSTLVSERYELRGVLGRGGMGVVYDAWDRELERAVALKTLPRGAALSDEARERFVQEAKAAARLSHPHIASVYDATPEAIAMQKIRGRTLAELLPLPPRLLAALLRDAALAIHYAHEQGVVHRDLKPANLMVEDGARPHVFVTDFSLAKRYEVASGLSASGSVVGTPAYMAPEQAAGRGKEVGPRSDVYGLGATLWAALAGRPPFEEQDLYALLARVVADEPRPLRVVAPDVDRDLETIVAKCMAKDPARRYGSALALAGDLDRFLRGEPIEARPASYLYRARRFATRRRAPLVAAAGALVLAALVLVPVALWQGARRASAERARLVAERVVALSGRVSEALRDVRALRASGGGHERQAVTILDGAIADVRAFLDDEEVGHAWLFLGRLLRTARRDDEALAALDRAEGLIEGSRALALERGLVLASLVHGAAPLPGEAPVPESQAWRTRALVDLRAALAAPAQVVTAERVFAELELAWLAGDRDGAIAKAREVLEMDGTHQETHLALSRLYLETGRPDLAMRHSVVALDLLRGYRPAYLANARGAARDDLVRPERELLALDGLQELLIDFNLLLQLEPSDAHAFGLRGQVAARRALRSSDPAAALADLELALTELGGVLQIAPDHAPALVARAALATERARRLRQTGDAQGTAHALEGALADYDAALLVDPRLAVAWYDRALLRRERAAIAGAALARASAQKELEHARSDAAEAVARAAEDHPWRARFAALAAEL